MSLIDGIISEERRYASMPYVETGSNHQIFSDIVNSYGLAGCQDQAWCATYQFALELQTCGKEQALRNWCMTDGYVGYSVFATRDKFKAAGRTGATPRKGALVIFKRSHMGRVLSVNSTTFECGEGNTSNKEFNRDGNSCAVKTYSRTDPGIDCFCYIDYEDAMNASQILNATKAVYEMAHNRRFNYGDSHALPPCDDGLISCDRLVARALWNLGYQAQPKGGITVINMEAYLLNWGFRKITDANSLMPGDIVLMRNASTIPNAGWHAFVISAFTSQNKISKYDCGGAVGDNWRINAVQPFTNVPLNEWGGGRAFYAAYRVNSKDEYIFTPSVVKQGATGASQYLANEILKAYNLKGVTGPIELNGTWTNGDMAAMCQWKLDRIRNGDINLCKGPYGAGEIGPKDWTSLLSSGLPFKAIAVPDKERKGPSVLLAQRILKANGFGNLALDAEYGPKTEAAIKAWQKANKRPETGKLIYDDWKLMLRNI